VTTDELSLTWNNFQKSPLFFDQVCSNILQTTHRITLIVSKTIYTVSQKTTQL